MKQREIKFRAWDKDEKKMYLENKLSEAEWVLYLSNAIKGKGKSVFMQYTGLKDKNGKEIYEGDKVRITHIEDKFDPVIVTISFVNFHWSCSDGGGKSLYNYSTILYLEYEVIGNIYENKDLLK